ncbi:MAG: hypothetical protein KGQ41_00700 [Alphaproteobacteria bacterium]|nr:hypothetical protein [Alphaproteobacteria bacterium]
MSIAAETAELVKPEDQKILFLDLEGVMTRGMMQSLSAVWMFHFDTDAKYSGAATYQVSKLVNKFGFKIVLITRHGHNDSEDLRRRLRLAKIEPSWLYREDPEAIPTIHQHKGDSVMEWLGRNTHIKIENTVALEDNPESLKKRRNGGTGYPEERIIPVNGSTGMIFKDYQEVLRLVGLEDPTLSTAATPQQKTQPQ